MLLMSVGNVKTSTDRSCSLAAASTSCFSNASRSALREQIAMRVKCLEKALAIETPMPGLVVSISADIWFQLELGRTRCQRGRKLVRS
jgi:hypothetical protein